MVAYQNYRVWGHAEIDLYASVACGSMYRTKGYGESEWDLDKNVCSTCS